MRPLFSKRLRDKVVHEDIRYPYCEEEMKNPDRDKDSLIQV